MAPKIAKTRATHQAQMPNIDLPAAETTALPIGAFPLEYWAQAQADLFRLAEPLLIGWLERCTDGGKAGFEAFAKLTACCDLETISTVHSEWLDGATRRLALDIEALATGTRAISQYVFEMPLRLGQTTAEFNSPGPEWKVAKVDHKQPPTLLQKGEVVDVTTSPADAIWTRR